MLLSSHHTKKKVVKVPSAFLVSALEFRPGFDHVIRDAIDAYGSDGGGRLLCG